MIEVWEIRNQDVHGKNKTEKQHRRKPKLAEQIWDLQKEKEYVRPRDERTVYRTIEHEPFNKLAPHISSND